MNTIRLTRRLVRRHKTDLLLGLLLLPIVIIVWRLTVYLLSP